MILISCLFSVSAVAQNKNQNRKAIVKQSELMRTAREGVGLEGIVVGRSTMADVIKKYGKDYRWTAHKKYSFSMAYPHLGLAFYICQSDKRKEIFDIEIRSPYKAKTGKGIILGKSTLEDIHRIYGRSKDGLEFKGVSFFYQNTGGKKTVTVIDIVENSGIRQCEVKTNQQK
jgi:hypothetical protein